MKERERETKDDHMYEIENEKIAHFLPCYLTINQKKYFRIKFVIFISDVVVVVLKKVVLRIDEKNCVINIMINVNKEARENNKLF